MNSGAIGAHRRGGVDMTEGSIFRHLLRFAFPLLVGSVFQQLYNTVDTWVVGNYVGDNAFSAVGTVGPIINMLIGFFLGLSSGAGVVISQYYGAKQEKKVEETVHTALVLTFLFSILFTVIGIAMTPLALRLMKMPAEVMPEAKTYLTIYFAGIAGLLFYNMGAGILRAVGDSIRPFIFLLVSALTNTGLDLLFVLRFHMGVEGVAYATVISQAFSAVLVLLILVCSRTCVRVSFRKLRLHADLCRKILFVGLPAALQAALTSFSNIFVQSYINYFGPDCMGGWTAYAKIDQFILLPMQAVALASTTFVGQNLGHGDTARAKRGVSISLWMALAATLLLMLPIVVFAPPIVSFFNDKPEIVVFGAQFLRTISPFYLLCTVNQIYAGALRGAGNSRAAMLIMLFSFVLFRQGYLFIVSRFISNTIFPISMSYPAGWAVCSLLTLIYYKKYNFGGKSLLGTPPTDAADTSAEQR